MAMGTGAEIITVKLDPFTDTEDEFLLKYWLLRYKQHLQSFYKRLPEYDAGCGLAILSEINRRKQAIIAKGWPNMTARETRLVTEGFVSCLAENVRRSLYEDRAYQVCMA